MTDSKVWMKEDRDGIPFVIKWDCNEITPPDTLVPGFFFGEKNV